jgi:hypothetical protein
LPLKIGAFALTRTGGEDFSTTINLDSKQKNKLLDSDRIWKFGDKADALITGKKTLFDLLVEKKSLAVNTILNYEGSFAQANVPHVALFFKKKPAS